LTEAPAGPPAVVDAHHHLWDLAVRDQPWTAALPPLRRSFALDDLRPALHCGNVTATVLVQTVTVAAETPEMLALAAAEPLIRGVVGWTPLDSPAIADRLARLRALPGGDALVGIRHQVQNEPDPRWLCRPAVRRGLEAVGAAGLSYDLLVTAEQLPSAIETVRALPEVRFVLDHAGNPPVDPAAVEAWRRDITELARAGNAMVKLSGLITRAYPGSVPPQQQRSWVQTLLDNFGPDRMMYGSDWPVCLLSATYEETLAVAQAATAALSAAGQRSVFADTAIRWYQLGSSIHRETTASPSAATSSRPEPAHSAPLRSASPDDL
jgi:L-fuconolactonase